MVIQSGSEKGWPNFVPKLFLKEGALADSPNGTWNFCLKLDIKITKLIEIEEKRGLLKFLSAITVKENGFVA
ncbi:MAG: hypothetical protein OHK0019_33230 [Saprospiraceae bacterium]